jgi:hypothetical protein
VHSGYDIWWLESLLKDLSNASLSVGLQHFVGGIR